MDLLFQDILNQDIATNAYLDAYTESVSNLLDEIEAEEVEKSVYFTEASDKGDSDKGGKAKAAIAKIFGIGGKDIETGSVPKKIHKQLADLEKIKKSIDESKNLENKIGEIEVTIPTTMAYFEFIDTILQNHVEKFTIDKSLNFFEKRAGTGKVIDKIVESLNKMTVALRKSKVDAVRDTDKEIKKLLSNNRADGAIRVYDRAPIDVNAKVTNVTNKDKDDNYTESAAIYASALTAMVAATCILGTSAENAINSVSHIPTKIRLQILTIEKLYDIIMETMEPQKFLTKISRISKKAASAVGSKASIAGFETKTGLSGSVAYANKINKLIKAYTNFYIALLDMYIRVIKEAIRMAS